MLSKNLVAYSVMIVALSFASCGESEKKVSANSDVFSPSKAAPDDQNLVAETQLSGMVGLIASHYQSCAPLLRPGKA